ncbi:ATP-binding protein [Nocardioides sp.]|uniref:ATP-binding protein n=1 Tax=Nocardioides sp. TaxID=35761 RepID=UPI002C7DB9A5|nr:ATP-binding protein [Nocardioides sp.]HXH78123.1 ATP-binding protein [Nocardioides sp.]
MEHAALVRAVVQRRLLDRLAEAGTEAPWLETLHDRAATCAPDDIPDPDTWWTAAALSATDPSTPLGRLSLDEALVVTMAGLIEDDIRFGSLFATLQEPLRSRRPCVGLVGWVLGSPASGGPAAYARGCHDLIARGVLLVDNPGDPRAEWTLRLPAAVWELLATGSLDGSALPQQLKLRSGFPPLSELALSEPSYAAAVRLPELVADGVVSAVVVRGQTGSGRTTVLAALAGPDLLVYDGDPGDPAWQLAGALARLADLTLVARCHPGPGETIVLPALPPGSRPPGVVLGCSGSVTGAALERAVTLVLGPCGPDDRRLLWRSAGVPAEAPDLPEIVERFLLNPGDIVRAAPLASMAARAQGRAVPTVGDVRAATRSLRRQDLETLATLLEPLPEASRPILPHHAAEELKTLVRRCRNRERLSVVTGGSHGGLNRGVRALFAGPSGTGKTLAARHVAALLQLDVYRVDLASVVNKYIGETERNLDRVLGRAEELDVLLLLDEGDALMTRRTEVSTANDRYANLETNFLLQRLETFDGIVVVTSNAAARIDPAFLRRIDVTVDFVAPDAEQRLQLWHTHLPADHEVDPAVLRDIARRCALTGGQIRNASLHALLLALDEGAVIGGLFVTDAVRREYRRAGAACPLNSGADGGRGVNDVNGDRANGDRRVSLPSW